MSRTRILLVEDDHHSGNSLRLYLEGRGCEVAWAKLGEDGLELLAREVFDVVLLDVNLPECDGFEVCRRVKSNPALRWLPVLMLTARGGADDKIRGFQQAADGYVTKPYDFEVLWAEIEGRVRVAQAQRALEAREAELYTLSTTDELTGLYNRRLLHESLEREIDRAHRYGTELAMLVIDGDRFKVANDTWGHAFGDDVLRGLARALTTALRACDIVARVGGDEFVALLPETDTESAGASAERLRAAVEALRFVPPGAEETDGWQASITVGVATCTPRDTPGSLWERADAALYEAKAAGRNTVRVSRADRAA